MSWIKFTNSLSETVGLQRTRYLVIYLVLLFQWNVTRREDMDLTFSLIKNESEANSEGFFLFKRNWNDYWEFETTYYLVFFDKSLKRTDIGEVKIANTDFAYSKETPSTVIPDSFTLLNDDFFSLGQSPDYYRNLRALGDSVATTVFAALRDISYDLAIYKRVINKQVANISLMRFIKPETVKGQFHRISRGGSRFEDFSFEYEFPASSKFSFSPRKIDFNVSAGSVPPTNIHVLIGRNGVGKSTLLDAMSRTFVLSKEDTGASNSKHGFFRANSKSEELPFVNLVSVSFSAFDSFTPISEPRNQLNNHGYTYIGLKKKTSLSTFKKDSDNNGIAPVAIKTPQALGSEFSKTVRNCLLPSSINRWKQAIDLLESDPVFARTGLSNRISELIEDYSNLFSSQEKLGRIVNRHVDELGEIFAKLSSGHKIVLLTISHLVLAVAERTMVLIDEPEAHLHPPLLSSFMHALSNLMMDRNGVALLATHSPVVLQEVPKECTWILNRIGTSSTLTRPSIETFGENVGILTSEVFGLEVSSTGFHRRLLDLSVKFDSYDDAIEDIGGKLGEEAKLILDSLIWLNKASN